MAAEEYAYQMDRYLQGEGRYADLLSAVQVGQVASEELAGDGAQCHGQHDPSDLDLGQSQYASEYKGRKGVGHVAYAHDYPADAYQIDLPGESFELVKILQVVSPRFPVR